MFQSLRHKIILVAAVCASITLLGFVALYWLTLEQHKSLDRHHDLTAVSLKWYSLNNAVHTASLAQKAWIDSGDLKFIKERDLTWAADIHTPLSNSTCFTKRYVCGKENDQLRDAFFMICG